MGKPSTKGGSDMKKKQARAEKTTPIPEKDLMWIKGGDDTERSAEKPANQGGG